MGARTVTVVHPHEVALVLVAVLDFVAFVWGTVGVWHTLRMLGSAPPADPRVPTSRLGQLRTVYVARFRGWVVVFNAALVGAAVADYDRDPRHGPARMLALFLVVTAVLVVMAGVSVGRAGYPAVANAGGRVHGYEGRDLLVSCIIGAVALGLGLLATAAALT